jgi:pyrrolysine biosynthesis protein PylD
MTRLTQFHIQETRAHLQGIDEMLRMRVHTDLLGVALRTIGVERDKQSLLAAKRVAVVPITAGEGIIPGFSETVRTIAGHIGLDARTTQGADVSGIAEAYAGGSDILVLADDVRFVAINTRSGAIADNDRATGEGFAALLEMMAGGVRGRPCGVIGCGPVGSAAALRLARRGADLTVCDINEDRGRRLVSRIRDETDTVAAWVGAVGALLATCRFIVDATPAAGIISADALRADSVITAPGVPIGLTPEAVDRIGPRFYHDHLPLGVATMILAAVFERMTETEK